MKYVLIYIFLMSVFHTSCGQNQTNIEDKKGNIWTTGSVNSNNVGTWALSRYDQKSLYNKTPTVTEIISGPPAFLGILEANDGSIWFGSAGWVHRYDGKTITDFKSAAGQK